MIKRPRFSAKQIKDLETMQKTEGWKIVKQMIAGSIEIGNLELINFQFVFDNGELTKNSAMQYQNKQKEIGILKEFLHFVENPVKVEENLGKSVYE